MKKISNLGDLKLQMKMVEQRRVQLEKELRHDWMDVKHDLLGQSNSFFSDMKGRYVRKLALQGLSFGAGMLVRKFGGKIGSKIYSLLK